MVPLMRPQKRGWLSHPKTGEKVTGDPLLEEVQLLGILEGLQQAHTEDVVCRLQNLALIHHMLNLFGLGQRGLVHDLHALQLFGASVAQISTHSSQEPLQSCIPLGFRRNSGTAWYTVLATIWELLYTKGWNVIDVSGHLERVDLRRLLVPGQPDGAKLPRTNHVADEQVKPTDGAAGSVCRVPGAFPPPPVVSVLGDEAGD